MVEIVERINEATSAWNLLGYLAHDSERVGEMLNGYPVLGPPEALDHYPDACLVPDNEWPRTLPLPRERLATLVDPSAFVSRTATIGPGGVVYPHCFIGLNVRLGDRVFCLSGCRINHDCRLGDRVVLASGVMLAGTVTVESDCYLGQGCTIRQQLHIGEGSLIGMGAVVLKDVALRSVIVGNPGRLR
jgi:sugar O-acyltransferase (sialic acid O-acetyltransferase NeuD family)